MALAVDWAPEMRYRDAAGKRVPYDECVDWFSLGCIMYEFLRGKSPFRTDKALEWCAETIQDKVCISSQPVIIYPAVVLQQHSSLIDPKADKSVFDRVFRLSFGMVEKARSLLAVFELLV